MVSADKDRLLAALIPSQLAEKALAAKGSIEGERKQVTALFADVEGSTALAEGLDPEDFLDIMNGAFRRMVEAVHRYEGMVDKFLGDGILALFGAPVIHEDDPRRAVQAALDIQDGLAEYADELEATHGIRLSVRIGLNTGTVVVGSVGSQLRMEYTAMGDAVNLAQRLESAASADQVLIGETTHRLVRHYFEVADVGPLTLKGKSRPVHAFQVLTAKPVVAAVRGIEGLSSPLVGREPEMSALQRSVSELAQGRGRIVSIIGEAGLGKSRLVAEAASSSTLENLDWAVGNALSYGEGLSYFLAKDVFRAILGADLETPPDKLGTLLRKDLGRVLPDGEARVFPYLAHLMDAEVGSAEDKKVRSLDGASRRQEILLAARRYLRARGSHRPLALVWEDLHWADPSSLQLLEAILPLAAEVPLLLVLTLRPQRDSTAWELHLRLTEEHPALHLPIELTPLDEEDGADLIRNLLIMEDLPTAVRELILAKAEGNPFFVEEIIRSLIESAILERQADRWVAAGDIGEIEIPDTLEGVILARIDRLPPESKRTLQMASVIGRTFQRRVLEVLTTDGGSDV